MENLADSLQTIRDLSIYVDQMRDHVGASEMSITLDDYFVRFKFKWKDIGGLGWARELSHTEIQSFTDEMLEAAFTQMMEDAIKARDKFEWSLKNA